ncbi:MAG: hypothetical protein JNM51_10200 [Bacteroidia bacterium]|nr:hypothetical protein [Bacteroidia bacterium]
MAKTILIPVDFTPESLNTLKLALKENSISGVNVILMYSEYLTDSITDLLFYSADRIIESHITPDFEETISILKNRYETDIKTIKIELFHGYNINSFKNFIEAKRIDAIYIPKKYTLKLKKNGFDPIPFIKKSGLPVQEMEWVSNFFNS